jgi:hypothetical protein
MVVFFQHPLAIFVFRTIYNYYLLALVDNWINFFVELACFELLVKYALFLFAYDGDRYYFTCCSHYKYFTLLIIILNFYCIAHVVYVVLFGHFHGYQYVVLFTSINF